MNKIKIGIFGAGVRGLDLGRNFLLLNCEIVAICEFRKERHAEAIQRFGEDVTLYDDFDAFLNHDMDAVILANFSTSMHLMPLNVLKKVFMYFQNVSATVPWLKVWN